MNRTYICAPIGSDDPAVVYGNCLAALDFGSMVAMTMREIPVTFAFMATIQGWLRDDSPEERGIGIDIDRKLLARCTRVRIMPGRISHGMHDELQLARELGIPVYIGLRNVDVALGIQRYDTTEREHVDPYPWFTAARTMLGVAEIRGEEHTQAIVAFHATTTLKATDDETPWCSSFVNWCFVTSGLKGTDSARSKSWLDWGEEVWSVSDPRPLEDCIQIGDVAVFNRAGNTQIRTGPGHVGFVAGYDPDDKFGGIKLLSGNVGDSVRLKTYPLDSLLAIRRHNG